MVGCGHTWVSRYNQGPAVEAMLAATPKLPLTLQLVQGRLLVSGSAAPGVAAGAELLAIDERPVADIVKALMPYLRADGPRGETTPSTGDGKRLVQLNSSDTGDAMDRLYPLLFPPVQSDAQISSQAQAPAPARYRLKLRDKDSLDTRDLTVAAMSEAARTQAI